MLHECFEGASGGEMVFQRLLEQMKDGRDVSVQALVMLWDQIKSLMPNLVSVDEEERKQTRPDLRLGQIYKQSQGIVYTSYTTVLSNF